MRKAGRAPGNRTTLATDAALRLLAARARSCYEIEDRLKRKGFGKRVRDRAISALCEWGYLDDAVFARAWVRSRMAGTPCGRRRIRAELCRKGGAEEAVECALKEYHGEAQEEELAEKLARKRLRALSGLEREVKRRRLWGLLLRRGFPAQVVSTVLGKVL